MLILFFNTIRTYYRLGLVNLYRVASYRMRIRLGIHPVQRLDSIKISGPFFQSPPDTSLMDVCGLYPFELILNGYWPFSSDYISFDFNMPDWHRNYFNGRVSEFRDEKWWKIPDFDHRLGDIKAVWEISRFDWVIQLSCLGAAGRDGAVEVLNRRLSDWIDNNPPFFGLNWKCGQEASFRVFHLLASLKILGQLDSPSQGVITLIEMHLKRIEPTIDYAIGQNNNHGPSEAIALFLGGSFLVSQGKKRYNRYASKGRYWLEDRAATLFDEEGCFSQYSVNYHRLALDIYSFCETFRRIFDLPSFSSTLYNRLQRATQWLGLLTDKESGNAPNIGANDGAKLFPFIQENYRDYRFCVQWASICFFNAPWFPLEKTHGKIFALFDLYNFNEKCLYANVNRRIEGRYGGFFIHRSKNILLVFRRPVFRFRPIQSDALHIDLWVKGVNLLRDGGTFSYHSTPEKMAYYGGASSHNTVTIDSIDPMPRISRFLFGSWLKEIHFRFKDENGRLTVRSGYRDYLDRTHIRSLELNDKSLQVNDTLTGVKNKAVLRWRLTPGDWKVSGKSHSSETMIQVDYETKTISGTCTLKDENESLYYMKESEIPVIQCQMDCSGVFSTTINWS